MRRWRREEIVLQYLVVLQHQNITHTWITVKCKKPSQMIFLKIHQCRHIRSL